MPAAIFPRTLLPNSVTPMSVPSGLVSVGHTGKAQLRSVVSMGRQWTETWAALRAGDAAVETLLAYIEWAYNTSQIFEIQHLPTPGSGPVPNGVGGGVPLVNGASQTGSFIQTDGWTASLSNIVRAGDVLRIAGVSPLLRATQDVNSNGSGQVTLHINPSIPAGSSPADNAPLTRWPNFLFAYIASPPNLPDVPPDRLFAGMTLTFREAL